MNMYLQFYHVSVCLGMGEMLVAVRATYFCSINFSRLLSYHCFCSNTYISSLPSLSFHYF